MYKTYRCCGCSQEWTERAGPVDCPSCGHRYVEVIGGDGWKANDNKKVERKQDEEKPVAKVSVSGARLYPRERWEGPVRIPST